MCCCRCEGGPEGRLETRRLVHSLAGHTNYIHCVAAGSKAGENSLASAIKDAPSGSGQARRLRVHVQ